MNHLTILIKWKRALLKLLLQTMDPSLPLASHQHLSLNAWLDAGLHSIPLKYVLPQSLRPSASQPLQHEHIPVIDLSNLQGQHRPQVVQAIGSACKQWGFFQVVNHGVSTELTSTMLQIAREFFAQPVEEKTKYFTSDVTAPVRFGTSFNAAVDKVWSWRDFLRHQCYPESEYAHMWPDKPTEYRKVAAEYCKEVRSLASRLLAAISESLGLSSDYIHSAFGEHSQILLLNHYPPCPNPDLTLGLASHSDGTGLTVLLQDEVPGLQVLRNGKWAEINPVKDAFVINIGDQLQILTNGVYESVEHRALVNAERSRISIASANGPSLHTVIAPAAQLIDEEHPPLYKPMEYSEYLRTLHTKGINGKDMVNSVKSIH